MGKDLDRIEPRRSGVPVPRDERGRILPGHTPNPSGRRRGVGGVARMILDRTRDGAEMVEFAERIWRNQVVALNTDGTEKLDESGAVVLLRGSYSDEQRWGAFQWLSDRGLGRPVIAVDMAAMVANVDANDVGAFLDVAALDEESVLAIDAVLARALPGGGEGG